jgi:GNAT superfamily N-acetyltransferase
MSTFDIQQLHDDDVDEVISVINAAFGFDRDADWYDWKHRSGPWGASAGVIARDGEGIVGVRLLLPWRFVGPGGSLLAHRATEAATAPRARGKGIFSILNRHLQEAAAEGEPTFFFSTPNEQSRGGYAKLGWSWLTPVPHVWRPVVPRRWKDPLVEGTDALSEFVGGHTAAEHVATAWSARSLAWRLDPRSGHEYRVLADAASGAGLAYRPIVHSRAQTLLPIFAWGGLPVRQRLLGEAARRERAVVALDTGEPGGSPVSSVRGKVRGESLLAVWPTPHLETSAWPLADVDNWQVGFADLENVL